jgi:hypothetical protein
MFGPVDCNLVPLVDAPIGILPDAMAVEEGAKGDGRSQVD